MDLSRRHEGRELTMVVQSVLWPIGTNTSHLREGQIGAQAQRELQANPSMHPTMYRVYVCTGSRSTDGLDGSQVGSLAGGCCCGCQRN